MTPYYAPALHFITEPQRKVMFPENQMHQKFVLHIRVNLAQDSAFTSHAMTRLTIVGYVITSLTKNNCTNAGSRHHRSHSSRKFAHC